LYIANGINRDEKRQKADDTEEETGQRIEPEMEREVRKSHLQDCGGIGTILHRNGAGDDRGQGCDSSDGKG